MSWLPDVGRGGRIVLALAVGGAVFGIATAVQADIPDGGTIHGCYHKANGQLSVIDRDKGQTCKSSESPLDWNANGPTGATGARGATGPKGATGATGPQGAPGTPGTTLGSFSKLVVLHDDAAGHAAGWDPDGSTSNFIIAEPNETDNSLFSITVNSGAEDSNGDEAFCWADTETPAPGLVHVQCNRGVNQGGTLVYLLVNP